MPRRKQESNPLLDIMDLYQSLESHDKATFYVWVGRQNVYEAPAKTADPAKRRGRKAIGLPAKEAEPEGVPICVTCGHEEAYEDHKEDSPVYHVFRTSLKVKNAKA